MAPKKWRPREARPWTSSMYINGEQAPGTHLNHHWGSSLFGVIFRIFMGHIWVRRGLEMILSHRAPSSLNMSSYRAIWTHFRSNSMIFEQIEIPKLIYLNFQISGKLVLIRRETSFPKVERLGKWCRTVQTKYSGAKLSKTPLISIYGPLVPELEILVLRSW